MKVNFQKILAVIVACSLSVMVCCVTVYADSIIDEAETAVDYISNQSVITGEATRRFWTTVGEVISGDKTFSEAQNDLSELSEDMSNSSLTNFIINYPRGFCY